MPIKLPSLRERLDDVPLLAAHFLKKYCEKNQKQIKSIAGQAFSVLTNYSYPGNIREFENILERAVIMEKGDTIQRIDLELSGAGGKPGHDYHLGNGDIQQFRKMKTEVVERFEKEYFSKLLTLHTGNMSRAARHAGINIKNFHEKMARYGLKKEEFK